MSTISSDYAYDLACRDHIDRGLINAAYYRRGAIVTGWPSRWPQTAGKVIHKRGIIRNATVRSLIRGGFAIANAPVDFDVMTTLTFREKPEHAKTALRDFCSDASVRPWLGTQWGWVQEFQERGVVHYHLLATQAGLWGNWGDGADCWETYRRGRGVASVLRGEAEHDIANAWMRATGDSGMAARKYNFGGIVERLRNPAAAGAYLGNYVSKMAQKQVPEGDPPEGRWWWLHPSLKAQPIGNALVMEWPFRKPHRLVFDKRKLEGSTVDIEPG